MCNIPNNLHPRCIERDESHPHFIFYCKLSKVTLDCISELINLNCSFLNLVSKPSKWALSQFYDGVHLKILPTLSEVIRISSKPVMKMDMIKSMNSLILNTVLSLFSTNSELLLMNKAQKKKKKKKIEDLELHLKQ